MTEKQNPSGLPTTRKKCTPAFKADCVRQVAAGVRRTNLARSQGISLALLGQRPRRRGLRALSTRPQRSRTTVADPAAAVAENRLLCQPAPTAPTWFWSATSRTCP